MRITTKNNLPEENTTKEILEDLLVKYDIPIFTENVIIEKKSIPHSHPVLTLNTRTDDPLIILKTLIHEQFHWFEAEHSKLDETINFLKEKYKKNLEFKDEKSFYIHIIVCFNTRNILKRLVSEKDLEFIYNQWQAYPLMEKFVEENFNKIKVDLNQFDMVFAKQ
jgi:hypothetical protein